MVDFQGGDLRQKEGIMYPDEYEKLKASQNQVKYEANTAQECMAGSPIWTPLDQMQSRANSVEQEHFKLSEGIQFLRENPQFNRFIELIRKGSIGI